MLPNDLPQGGLVVFDGEQIVGAVLHHQLSGRLVLGVESIELPNGCSRSRLRLASIEELEGWAWSGALHAAVVGPKGLITCPLRTATELQKRYAEVSLLTAFSLRSERTSDLTPCLVGGARLGAASLFVPSPLNSEV